MRTEVTALNGRLAPVLELARRGGGFAAHAVDLPYRLCSPAAVETGNSRLWWAGPELVAWAIWQPAWACLDLAIGPRAGSLRDDVIDWGLRRFESLATRLGAGRRYRVEVRDDDAELAAVLAGRGFRPSPPDTLHLTAGLPADHGGADPRVRAIGDGGDLEADLEAAVALQRVAFGSTNMTVDWRRRMRTVPGYEPTLDLLAVDDRGEPVGFCLGWRDGIDAQIEPIGIHPGHHRRGLAGALIAESRRRMYAIGARRIHVDVHTDNEPAVAAYRVTGFSPAHRVLAYAATI